MKNFLTTVGLSVLLALSILALPGCSIATPDDEGDDKGAPPAEQPAEQPADEAATTEESTDA